MRVMRIVPLLFAYFWVTEMFPQNEISAGLSASTFLNRSHWEIEEALRQTGEERMEPRHPVDEFRIAMLALDTCFNYANLT